jgi:hypothetical protein
MLVGLYLHNVKTAKSSCVIAPLTGCFFISLLALFPMLNKSCPFCGIASQANHPRIISQNSHSFVMRDGFSVSLFYNAIL